MSKYYCNPICDHCGLKKGSNFDHRPCSVALQKLHAQDKRIKTSNNKKGYLSKESQDYWSKIGT